MGCSTSKAIDVRPVRIKKINQAAEPINIVRNISKEPSDKMTELLQPLKKQMSSKHLDFEKSFDTLSEMLKNIANNFETEKFKKIKKKNKRFSKDLGWYKDINELMNLLGFQDQGEFWIYSEGLGKSHVQMRVLDLSIAYKKLQNLLPT